MFIYIALLDHSPCLEHLLSVAEFFLISKEELLVLLPLYLVLSSRFFNLRFNICLPHLNNFNMIFQIIHHFDLCSSNFFLLLIQFFELQLFFINNFINLIFHLLEIIILLFNFLLCYVMGSVDLVILLLNLFLLAIKLFTFFIYYLRHHVHLFRPHWTLAFVPSMCSFRSANREIGCLSQRSHWLVWFRQSCVRLKLHRHFRQSALIL